MSKINARFLGDDEGYAGNVSYSRAVPAVIYEPRLGGMATRVERDGKGGHLTLSRADRGEQIVMPGRGVVGVLGFSGQADSWCVSITGQGEWFADNRGDVIGLAALALLS